MEKQEVNKYVVLSFKTSGINTFNVIVIDIETSRIRFWHESYQLWESKVCGFLLASYDFLIISSKGGVNLLSLGEKPNRLVKDDEGNFRDLHSLGSCNYLRVSDSNHVFFSC